VICHYQWLVAHGTTGKGAIWLQIQIGQDLPDLIVQELAGDEQDTHTATPGQLPVASEDQPVLGAGQAHQLVIVNIRLKQGVVTQDAQPLGQRAKHGISDKPYGQFSTLNA